MIDERFHDLLDSLLESELSSDEVAELDAALRANVERRRTAADRLAEHRLLGILHRPQDDSAACDAVLDRVHAAERRAVNDILTVLPAPMGDHASPRGRRAKRLWGAGLVAVATIVWLAAVSIRWTTGQPDGKHLIGANASTVEAVVGTLLVAEGCMWKHPGEMLEGARLRAGSYELQSGMAVMRLDGGAEIILRAGTSIELHSAGEARLGWGAVTVRMLDGFEGFRLQTPHGDVIDLGTEFSVRVDAAGETEVNVLEGRVAWQASAAEERPALLSAGEAAVLRSNGVLHPQPISADEPRFSQLIENARLRERRDLMTVYEGFHYDAGSYAPEEITTGHGWAGPWRLRTAAENTYAEGDQTSDMRIVHGRLNVAWPVPGGRLGMLEFPPGKTYRVRPMKQPIDLGDDGICYFSLMVHEPDHSQRTRRSRPLESMRLTFRSSHDYFGESVSFGVSNQLRPQIQTGHGGAFPSAAEAPWKQTTLWVGKILSRRDGEDEIQFRIYGEDDELDVAEPAEWHVASRNVDHSAALDLVVLTSSGQSPRVVDELRIGPTWRSVVPVRPSSPVDGRDTDTEDPR